MRFVRSDSVFGHCVKDCIRNDLCVALVLAAAVGVGFCGQALAGDAALQNNEPTTEPMGFTDVIDAFDERDVWDLNLRIGFSHAWRTGTIRREAERRAQPASGVGPAFAEIAQYKHATSQLLLGLDVGLWRDLMAFVEMPLVLADVRELELPEARSAEDVREDLKAVSPTNPVAASDDSDVPTDFLFDVPFKSSTRNGVPHVELGLAWAVTNQVRLPHLPTWLLMLKGRVGVGQIMRPSCRSTTGEGSCTRVPGISEGIAGLRFETRSSYRFRYVEPYAGAAWELRWPGPALKKRLRLDDLPKGVVNRGAPDIGEMTLGFYYIPWEDRAAFRRVAFDLRLNAAYVLEGRDYSPLFDALGTSSNPYLTGAIELADTEPDDGDRSVLFYGLTDVEEHLRVGLGLSTVLQATAHLRMVVGLGLVFATPHLITATDACNPDYENETGACAGIGIPNPNHRAVIDQPGQRFGIAGDTTLHLSASAVGQF